MPETVHPSRVILEARNCRKTFGNVEALKRITLQIPAEKTTILIGPSGCGKSTLLRLMIGLLAPDAGEIYFDGQEIRSRDLLDMRREMGYVIQEGGLFPHLNARNNVTLMARYLRWPKDAIRDRLWELAEMTQFPKAALERYPAELSGGQRQRLALMRALMLNPKVLLLDEPLGALDPIIRFDLQGDLKRIFRRLGKTVVLVTHDLGEAGYFGDRLVLMRDGEIIQEGDMREFIRAPADPFVTRFLHAQRMGPESGASLGR